jgi:hypothetical protein
MTSSINDCNVHHEHALIFSILILPPLTNLPHTFVPNHRNLDHSKFTLHLWWIETPQSFVGILLLLVFIYPFTPIDLDILIFCLCFQKSRPESCIFIFFLDDKDEMKACFCPFRSLTIDLGKELKTEFILLFVWETNKC